MTDEFSMNGIEDVLDYFDIEKTYKLINEQLRGDDASPSGALSDHLKPLWVKYKSIKPNPNEGIDAAVITAVDQRFDAVCRMFIDIISKKYGITVDIGWLDNQSRSTIHSIALIMYTFFVLDLEVNIKEVLYKYIVEHSSELAHSFGDNLKSRKDSPYLVLKKSLQPDYAVIGANINDIAMWILDQMDEEEFFNYLGEDYMPEPIIKDLFDNGHMDGHFMGHIYNHFINNNTIRCRIIFDLISILKNNHKKEEKDD
jgi:hypothetical protein